MSIGLIHLIYTSTAVRDMQVDDIESIMRASLERNARLDITGLLVYFGGTREFIQLLEGEEAAVLGLYHDFIRRDERHSQVRIYFVERAAQRLCPDWRMSFRLAGDGALRDRLPVSDFVDGGPLDGDHRALSRAVMIGFRDEIIREQA
ncbi:BLUF domain-containing protein [Breoghania sp. L-A4]|uniref:BLUF domain-containing protein n=1 Tax=Breoghania sp. L-A4 TaxID=2304600 RepID=UPI000E35D4A2|nr:BLUF domain-containing protein [Breoghania sp. L-A4]AXS41721.1 BLUF domain-containing protein [Breoghania sp. L-A4]